MPRAKGRARRRLSASCEVITPLGDLFVRVEEGLPVAVGEINAAPERQRGPKAKVIDAGVVGGHPTHCPPAGIVSRPRAGEYRVEDLSGLSGSGRAGRAGLDDKTDGKVPSGSIAATESGTTRSCP
jgi:hypothetical protein